MDGEVDLCGGETDAKGRSRFRKMKMSSVFGHRALRGSRSE